MTLIPRYYSVSQVLTADADAAGAVTLERLLLLATATIIIINEMSSMPQFYRTEFVSQNDKWTQIGRHKLCIPVPGHCHHIGD